MRSVGVAGDVSIVSIVRIDGMISVHPNHAKLAAASANVENCGYVSALIEAGVPLLAYRLESQVGCVVGVV